MRGFRTDSFFAIGSTHDVCEDYAKAGVLANGDPYGIVSDGCSSSENSDFGARLLVSNCFLMMNAGFTVEDSKTVIAFNAAATCKTVGLQPEASDATLSVIERSATGPYLSTIFFGDGVAIVVDKSGRVWILTVEFSAGYPAYLSYLTHRGRANVWNGMKQKRIARYLQYEADLQTICVREVTSECLSPEDFSGYKMTWALDDVRLILVASDGIQSFQTLVQTETGKYAQPVPLNRIVADLIDLKLRKGRFMLRKYKSLRKKWDKEGISHTDDLSVAAVMVDDG